MLERDAALAGFVVDRLVEGWTPEQIAGRLRRGIERGLRSLSTETIYAWIFRAAQKTEKLWRYLPLGRARRGWRRARASMDRLSEKIHVSQRSDAADARAEVGHWEADLVICHRSRPILVLHERKNAALFANDGVDGARFRHRNVPHWVLLEVSNEGSHP